jgi:hypothetical protein
VRERRRQVQEDLPSRAYRILGATTTVGATEGPRVSGEFFVSDLTEPAMPEPRSETIGTERICGSLASRPPRQRAGWGKVITVSPEQIFDTR